MLGMRNIMIGGAIGAMIAGGGVASRVGHPLALSRDDVGQA